MAATAIALYIVFVALGFGWRSWNQYRRTGSTGFRGVSAPVHRSGSPASGSWSPCSPASPPRCYS